MTTHWLIMDGWAGRSKHPVEIVGDTPKKYLVKLLADCRLPGRNKSGKAGQVILVPRYAVSDKPPGDNE